MSDADRAIHIHRQRERYKEFETRQEKTLLITERFVGCPHSGVGKGLRV